MTVRIDNSGVDKFGEAFPVIFGDFGNSYVSSNCSQFYIENKR